jgi:tRNA threonylcarbamoyladenosine biosynthesis protein TsaE
MKKSDLFTSHVTCSAEETERLGKALGEILTENALLAFYGDLGSGKTTFIRGLTEAVGSIDSRCISSPTFNFLHIYEGNKTIYHFDLYRLPHRQEFFTTGFDEYLEAGGICCIEWAEKLYSTSELLSKHPQAILLEFSYEGPQGRRIEITRGAR